MNVAIETDYVDPYPGRKGSERIYEKCGKCSGTGVYSGPSSISFYTATVGAVTYGCLQCKGTGRYSFLVSSARATARRRAETAVSEHERVKNLMAAYADFNVAHGATAAALEDAGASLRDGDPLKYSMRDLLEEVQTITILTIDRGAWILKAESALEQLQQREDSKRPVPVGRTQLTGTTLSFKRVENRYGSTLKMLVGSEGWKVWGSVPAALSGVSRGDLIEFEATVVASDDDPAFGFFSRPTKARLIEAATTDVDA